MPASSIEDRILIRELYGRYAIAAATQNAASWLACWSQTGTWKTPHIEVTGQEALSAMWDATWVKFSNVAPYNEVGEIMVNGDTATAVSTVLEFMSLLSGGTLRMAGIYTDAFVREDATWRFARREYTLLNQESGTPA